MFIYLFFGLFICNPWIMCMYNRHIVWYYNYFKSIVQKFSEIKVHKCEKYNLSRVSKKKIKIFKNNGVCNRRQLSTSGLFYQIILHNIIFNGYHKGIESTKHNSLWNNTHFSGSLLLISTDYDINLWWKLRYTLFNSDLTLENLP